MWRPGRRQQLRSEGAEYDDVEQRFGLVQVCLDPYVNGLHVSLLRRRKKLDHSREYFHYLSTKLITQGPNALSKRELIAVMYDPDTVTHLHYELWKGGKPVDPLSIDLPPGDPIGPADLPRWELESGARLALLGRVPPHLLASADPGR